MASIKTKPQKTTHPIVIITTTDKPAHAKKLAALLIENNLAACVNIVPKILSYYRWNNKVAKDDELILIIKTFTSCKKNIFSLIKAEHHYKIPACTAIQISDMPKSYLQWMKDTIT